MWQSEIPPEALIRRLRVIFLLQVSQDGTTPCFEAEVHTLPSSSSLLFEITVLSSGSTFDAWFRFFEKEAHNCSLSGSTITLLNSSHTLDVVEPTSPIELFLPHKITSTPTHWSTCASLTKPLPWFSLLLRLASEVGFREAISPDPELFQSTWPCPHWELTLKSAKIPLALCWQEGDRGGICPFPSCLAKRCKH